MFQTTWPQTCIEPVPGEEQLEHVRYCSPFAASLIDRHPEWLEQLQADRLEHPSPPHPMRAREWVFSCGLDDGLRDFRNQEMLRIIWRDLCGLAPLGETFDDLSALAETCIDMALEHHHEALAERFGEPRDSGGKAQKAVVLGVGKLGGNELNLSSDIDLIFCFPSAGQCDGPRARSNDEFFSTLSRKVIATLSEVRSTGFCFRVDTRLRPFGRVGAIACSFASLEQYYQREGRSWERYALIKARPVSGDIESGQRLLKSLRPFIYRRYIDFGAIEALLEMQALIRAETRRLDRHDDIKRGAGGIREIEFLAQGFQLLRGGRNTRLQTPSLALALEGIAALNLLPGQVVDSLRRDYVLLRHTENRIQAMHDQQTHVLPSGDDRARLLKALGMDLETFGKQLESTRGNVSRLFDDTWAKTGDDQNPGNDLPRQDEKWQQRWQQWRAENVPDDSADQPKHASAIQAFLTGLTRKPIGHTASQRLDRFMPMLLERIDGQALPDGTVDQLLDLVLAITRRSAYLTLLTENPAAFDRSIELFSRSRWVAKQVIRFPELLDDLIDPALGEHIPDAGALDEAVNRKLGLDDEESVLTALNYLKRATGLRIAVAWLEGQVDEASLCTALTTLAEAMIKAAWIMAEQELVRKHGSIEGSAHAVIGYGSLGSGEMGFGSDLDLVFLYEARHGESDGPRPLAPERWFARLAQRMVALLTALTPSGKLYEIDTRLRPNGQSGLLVSSIRAFGEYQRNDAWTWEAQALTRARAITGDRQLIDDFERIRNDSLRRPRDPAELGKDLLDMRQRIRETHGDGSKENERVKHAAGGMVDIGFLAQLGILLNAPGVDAVTHHRSVTGQLESLHECGWISENQLSLLKRHLSSLRHERFEQELEVRSPGIPSDKDAADAFAIAELFSRLAGGVE